VISTARLVLVPGLGLDARSSARLRRRLPADVVPLPGMGVRAPVPDVDALADRLCAALGEGPVVLVGHSQSCQVVAAAAGRDRRIVAVVLLGPTTDPRLRSPWGMARRWIATVLHEAPWQYPYVLAQWLRTGPRAMSALWRAASPDRIDRRLAAVPVPVTVVRGTSDRLCPADWARTVADAAGPGTWLVELPGAAHMTPQTRPDAVAAVLSAVLAGVPGGTADNVPG
jgi:pimeloyl-ACP methyl ester carboxylesterase